MNTKHTPGPWVFFKDGFGDHSIESAQDSNRDRLPVAMTFRRNNADAHLITAAPDLLNMLRRVMDEYLTRDPANGPISSLTLEQARAAIAKAEGNQ